MEDNIVSSRLNLTVNGTRLDHGRTPEVRPIIRVGNCEGPEKKALVLHEPIPSVRNPLIPCVDDVSRVNTQLGTVKLDSLIRFSFNVHLLGAKV
jgi:hypothetical protein